ncbi:aspartic peptidase domain-containing protein [Mycena haematopus]|nr:aspartic peptidase domain-containing protein [Mycena haematopus]
MAIADETIRILDLLSETERPNAVPRTVQMGTPTPVDTSGSNTVRVTAESQPPSKHMGNMSRSNISVKSAPQILAHAAVDVALDAPNLETGFVNPDGYAEHHIWVLRIGAGTDNRRFGALRIDTGSKTLMAFTLSKPRTVVVDSIDPKKINVIQGYHGYNGGPHQAISADSPAFTRSENATTEPNTLQQIARYAGGTVLCGHLYKGDLSVEGPSGRNGIPAIHTLHGMQFGGIHAATLDFVGSKLDGIVGLEPDFDRPASDFVQQVATTDPGRVELTGDVFMDLYMNRELKRSRFQVGGYSGDLLSEADIRFIPLVDGRRRYWTINMCGFKYGDRTVLFPQPEPIITDSGSVFSYFSLPLSPVLDEFYALLPNAVKNEDIWTFTFESRPERIYLLFDLGDGEQAVHSLSMRQFIWEKGDIQPGQRVHGGFQPLGGSDGTVAKLRPSFRTNILGQSFLCTRSVYYSRSWGAIAFGKHHSDVVR